MNGMMNNPFFAAHQEQMNQMNSMFRDPFGGMMASPFLSLTDGRPQQQLQQNRQGSRANAMMPMDPFGHGSMFDMFGNMNRMMNSTMGGMQTQMNEMNTMPQGGNGQFYSHSSVMSYSNDGSGRPKVYQATSSTTQAPGGLRETRKTLRDSEQGIEKMSMRRDINERAHVISKERVRGGDINDEEELINLDEGEKEGFEREWREKTRPYSGRHRALGGARGNHRYAAHRSHHHHQHHHHHNERHHPHQRPSRPSHSRPAVQAAIEYPESYRSQQQH